jgi:hypothetical protein
MHICSTYRSWACSTTIHALIEWTNMHSGSLWALWIYFVLSVSYVYADLQHCSVHVRGVYICCCWLTAVYLREGCCWLTAVWILLQPCLHVKILLYFLFYMHFFFSHAPSVSERITAASWLGSRLEYRTPSVSLHMIITIHGVA